MRLGAAALTALAAVPLAPAAAQSSPEPEPDDGRLVIDILAPTDDQADPVSVERCEERGDIEEVELTVAVEVRDGVIRVECGKERRDVEEV